MTAWTLAKGLMGGYLLILTIPFLLIAVLLICVVLVGGYAAVADIVETRWRKARTWVMRKLGKGS